MELKRILARDLRSATEQATALYGSDALIISHEIVNGRTEVIVAVDLKPAEPAELFEGSMGDSDQGRIASPVKSTPEPDAFADVLLGSQRVRPEHQAVDIGREQIRAREIVDLVRQEMTALRKEMRISQQQALSPFSNQNPIARMFDKALEADHAPVGLRLLLSEELESVESPPEALERLSNILRSSLRANQSNIGPLTGLHAIFGPSGSGKTSTVLRLAQQTAEYFGENQVCVISWADHRPGAWSQIQLGCARLGVECLRVQQAEQLADILEAVGQRRLVIVDAPGHSLTEHRQQLVSLCPDCMLHLVLPADVAAHQAERLLRGFPWQSLLLSKLDEAHHLWGIIQALSHVPAPLNQTAGCGPQPHERVEMSVDELVRIALDGLTKRTDQAEIVSKPARMGTPSAASIQPWARP